MIENEVLLFLDSLFNTFLQLEKNYPHENHDFSNYNICK